MTVFRLLALLVLGVLVAPAINPSGTAAQGTPFASPTAAEGDFSGLVDIGSRQLWLECRGAGGPTVILISGYRNDAEIWDTPALSPDSDQTAVLPGVATFTRACAYDRPGTVLDLDHRSRSDPVSMPRTAADGVSELHALLQAAGVPGPYVLAGHSFGGLFARLYAATYPDEVVGMVLVDALPEGLETLLKPDEWANYERLNAEVPPGFADYPDLETLDFAASFAQMRQAAEATPMCPIPLVVLSHGQSFGVPADALGFSPEALERAWAVGQDQLAALVSGARHVVVADSAHYIQLEQPAVVIDAIRDVVEAVRDPAGWATPVATLSR